MCGTGRVFFIFLLYFCMLSPLSSLLGFSFLLQLRLRCQLLAALVNRYYYMADII